MYCYKQPHLFRSLLLAQKNSLCTIRNIANVCCVQFSAKSSHLVAFGSADYKTYCYDLRNVSRPWCVLAGHDKAVSFVKFLDAETLVSASTDNTLKIWDLNKTSTSNLSTSACISTLRGHANEKVGFSILGACEVIRCYSFYRPSLLALSISHYCFNIAALLLCYLRTSWVYLLLMMDTLCVVQRQMR